MSTPSTVAMVAALASDALWSATAHRWDIYERNAFDVKQRSVSFVRAISDRGEHDLRARMPALNGRIRRLHLGTVVPDRVTPPRLNDAGFRIVCPAAFVPVKGHRVLLAALAILRRSNVPVRCTLYGTGPLQADLEAEAESLKLRDAVRFGGFIARDTLHNAYRLGWFSAVVLASRSAGVKMMEGTPSALIEAMAFGVPVVATDSGSVGELLDDRCGLLVKCDDADALAAALLNVYRNPDAARERADRAYDLVSARHDVRTQMRELASAFERKYQE
jgi:colanic acid/amylovoran biosynthesis glycosyltransferase